MAANRKRPNVQGSLDRRDFVKAAGVTALAASNLGWLVNTPAVHAAPTPQSAAETALGRLYATLSDAQKKQICLPFNHEKQQRISANWHITEPTIGGDFYSAEQRQLIKDIFRNVTSEDGYERFMLQLDHDYGGFENYSIAIFGEPGGERFEWAMTGRHLTIRADGNTADGVAFGGPMVYGHGESDPAENVFHYQTKKANEVFQALDAKQAEKALLTDAPRENQVPIQGREGSFPGISVGELSSDQKELVEQVIKVILAPYRQEDVDEAVEMLKAGGGLESLHMAFYKKGDLKNDQVWDIWRVEGPSFVWHFRGAPHVHAYVNIGTTKLAEKKS